MGVNVHVDMGRLQMFGELEIERGELKTGIIVKLKIPLALIALADVAASVVPKTHKICDEKNFFGIKFGDFGEIWWNYIYSAKQRHVASPDEL